MTQPTEELAFVDGPAGKLRVDDGGQGAPAALFVHGLAGDGRVWTAQLRHLRRRRRAVALDLRGHGASALAAGAEVSIHALAADVLAAADALGLGEVVLIGHSLGASVAGCAAGLLGARCKGLYLVDPASNLSGRNLQALDEAAVRAMFPELLAGATPRTREVVMAGVLRTPIATSVAFRNSAHAYDALAPLRALTARGAPVEALMCRGFAQSKFRLTAVLPEIREDQIAETSHWPQLDDPEELNGRLDRFFKRIA